MTKEEKLERITKGFSQLPEAKQDYILGILQALVYAHEHKEENDHSDSDQKSESV